MFYTEPFYRFRHCHYSIYKTDLSLVKRQKNTHAKNSSKVKISRLLANIKTYQFGRSIKFCIRSVNLDKFRYLSLDNYILDILIYFFVSKQTVLTCETI